MSKIDNSDQVLWPQDTPLPPLTLTTSAVVNSTRMERYIATVVANPWVWGLLAVVGVSALCSGFVTFWMVSRLDGQRWIGWTGQQVVLNGKARSVLIPLYMKPDDLKDLREGK